MLTNRDRTRRLACCQWARPGTLALVALLWLAAALPAAAVTVTPQEMAAAHAWVAAAFGEKPTLPFSFVYGGKPSAELLGAWQFSREVRKLDAQRTQYTLRYRDGKSGLELRCTAVEYQDFPTVEWTLYFHNTAAADTPILEQILPLDAAWQQRSGSETVLHHAVGSPAGPSDYGPLDTPLGPGAKKRIAAAGGRPTNSDWSYFNLQWGDEGMILAVGWPGQWAAEFVRDARPGAARARRPGADPLQAAARRGSSQPARWLSNSGKATASVRQNIWRRWMMAHSMPKPGGKLPPPQFVASSSRAYGEMIGANEANQIMHIDRYLEEGLKLDYWWMDAGWYVQQNGWPQVGTWEVDPRRFPRGLQADQRPRPCQGRQDPRLVRAGAGRARHMALREPPGVAPARLAGPRESAGRIAIVVGERAR